MAEIQVKDKLVTVEELAYTMPITSSTSITIPSAGSSVSKNMSGLTSKHQLVVWNFSVSAENAPPVELSWTTYDGYFTITNNGGNTSESIKPVFMLPYNTTITNH